MHLPGANLACESASTFLLRKPYVLNPECDVGLESLDRTLHDVQLSTDKSIVADRAFATGELCDVY